MQVKISSYPVITTRVRRLTRTKVEVESRAVQSEAYCDYSRPWSTDVFLIFTSIASVTVYYFYCTHFVFFPLFFFLVKNNKKYSDNKQEFSSFSVVNVNYVGSFKLTLEENTHRYFLSSTSQLVKEKKMIMWWTWPCVDSEMRVT